MADAVAALVSSAPDWPTEQLDLLRKILQNVLNSPAEEKFRRLKAANPKVSALLAAPGCSEGLMALGWNIGEMLELPAAAELPPLAEFLRKVAAEVDPPIIEGPPWVVTVMRGPLRTRLELAPPAKLGQLARAIERNKELNIPRCRQSLLSGYPPKPIAEDAALADLGIKTVMLVDIWEELVSDLRGAKASFVRLDEAMSQPALRTLMLRDNQDFVLQQVRRLLRQRAANTTTAEMQAARRCMQVLWPEDRTQGERKTFCASCAGSWLSPEETLASRISSGLPDDGSAASLTAVLAAATDVPTADQSGRRFVLEVDRSDVFSSALAQVTSASPHELHLPLEIRFKGEAAEDAGGLRREFFNEFGRSAAACSSASSSSLWQLTPAGALVPVPLQLARCRVPSASARRSAYRGCGRVFGLALCQAERPPKQALLLGLPLAKSFIRVVQGDSPGSLVDLQAELNAEQKPDAPDFRGSPAFLQKSLRELGLEGQLAFSSTMEQGESSASLAPGDAAVPVTDGTKEAWLLSALRYELVECVEEAAAAFRAGVCELVGSSHLALLTASELGELWAGHATVTDEDVKEWRKRTTVSPAVTQQAEWLFQMMGVEIGLRGRVLKFATGSDRWPVNPQGFSFAIEPLDGGDTTLPCAMTCGNMLQLPRFSSEEVLRDKLLQAMDWGVDMRLS